MEINKIKNTIGKYLVIADTYIGGYGCELTLFGIFDTHEDAVNWILEHPTVCTFASESDEEDQYEEYFDFFSGYDEEHGGILKPNRRSMWGEQYIQMTKEEYIGRRGFVRRFNGEPTYIGGYVE